MQMNKQKLHRLIFVLFLLVFSVLVMAQGTGTEKQETATAQGTPGTDEPAERSPQASDGPQQGEDDAADGSDTAVKSIKEFKPTEQIEADSAVSFPIDI